MKHGILSSVWIDDFFYIIDCLNISATEYALIDSQLMEVFKLLRLRLNKKCIRRPSREVLYTGSRINTNHARVFVSAERLQRYWDFAQEIASQKFTTISRLESLRGKLKFVIGKRGVSPTFNTFDRLLSDNINRALQLHPTPWTSNIHLQVRRRKVHTPTFIQRMFVELLQIVENDTFNLNSRDSLEWYIITDAGDRAFGGFGYTTQIATREFRASLPHNMWPEIDTNHSDEIASGSRELYGLVRVMEHILAKITDTRVHVLVDNTNVVDWLLSLNSEKHVPKSPLREKLIKRFYQLCLNNRLDFSIDHHRREQPLAMFADFLSKVDTIHIPWNMARCVTLTVRGWKKIRHLAPKWRLPRIAEITRRNEQLPWKDLLSNPIPIIKPLHDRLQETAVLVVPFGFHNIQRYDHILHNLIRYRYQGIILIPEFSFVTNLFFQYFVRYRYLKKGTHYRKPRGSRSPRCNFLAFVFEKPGVCG